MLSPNATGSRRIDALISGSARKAVFKRLKPGRYKFRIAAVNAVDTSPYSTWVKVRICWQRALYPIG